MLRRRSEIQRPCATSMYHNNSCRGIDMNSTHMVSNDTPLSSLFKCSDLLTILKHTAKQYRSIFQYYKHRNRRCWKTHAKISNPGKICDAAWRSYPLYGTKSHSIFHDFDAQCAEDTKCRFKIDIINQDRQQLTSFAPNVSWVYCAYGVLPTSGLRLS